MDDSYAVHSAEIKQPIVAMAMHARGMRRTLCFSEMEQMHDVVIGPFINRYEFGRAI